MRTRGITKADFDFVVTVLDRWWGGPSGEKAHPMFFYEFGDQALIVEDDGQIIGFLLGFVANTTPPTGYVHLVGIHPDHRRRGVGKVLYEQFTERCIAGGARRMKAISNVGHEGSERFHRALGFTAREEPDYAGPNRARMVFVKDL